MRRTLEPVPAAQLDEWFAAEYGPRLRGAGFSPVDRRRWVRSDKEPIREGFAVTALKGYSFAPIWFVSLDYVPHVTGGDEVRWHRTEKSAMPDLRVDPADTPWRYLARVLEVHGMGSPRTVRARTRRSAAFGVRAALAWFSRISDVASLLPTFERAERRAVRFPFDFSVQHRLALAFTIARLGDAERAEREFARWCAAREGLSPGAESRLRDLLHAAATPE